MASTVTLTSYVTANSHTDVKREIVRIPAATFTGSKITSIKLSIVLRHGNKSSKTPAKGKMWISTGYTKLSGWSLRSDSKCPYQTTSTGSTYFSSSTVNQILTGDMLVSAQEFSFIVPDYGNQTYTATFTPTVTDVSRWSGKDLYVGYEKISTPSDCETLWGTKIAAVKLEITYETNRRPGLVASINYPAFRLAYTYNTKPYFQVTMGTDPDGDQLQLGYAIYDNNADSWPVATTWLSTWYNGGATVNWQCSTTLTRGHTYSLICYQRDTSYVLAETGSTQQAFYIDTPISAVKSGDLFDDATIDALQVQINNLRAYYGLGAYSFTTCNYGTKALDDHIDEMEVAFEATPHKTNVASIDAGAKFNITNINNLRTGLLNG